MAETAAQIYENHLKGAYSVKKGDKILAITDTSCYNLPEATAWLTANLPETGTQKDYSKALAGLGLEDPEKIFRKLLDIGALQQKAARTWRSAAGALFMPKLRLIPAQWQDRFSGYFGAGPGAFGRLFKIFAWPALVGLLWGLWLLAGGGDRLLPPEAAGKANAMMVLALVLAGSLVHELGHSFAAAASGIGLRPIGFSIYLIYPAFYTNVSGIDKLALAEKVRVDCGGFLLQSVYVLGLLLFSAFTGSASAAEAVRWIIGLMLFNMNPFFRTDGYWLYKDTYSEFKHRRWARAVHYVYLTAFFLFSAYFLWFVAARFGRIWGDVRQMAFSPSYFFSGGYKVILGAYFIFTGLSGGLRRFKEGRQEWRELAEASKIKAS